MLVSLLILLLMCDLVINSLMNKVIIILYLNVYNLLKLLRNRVL